MALSSDVPPSYRERLRSEGRALALSGAAGTIVLLLASSETDRGPLSTAVQLAIVAALLALLGPRSVHAAIEGSEQILLKDVGSGEPTPLWQLPAIVLGLAMLAGLLAGWDAGLRVTLGCVLVGLAQAVLLERIVAADEERTGRRYFRVAGSRILRGTKLGYLKL